jgi:hypothetical protein
LTACDDDELSQEAGALANGVFTEFLLQAMSRAAADANANGQLSIEEAFNYLATRTSAYNPSQHPQIYDGNGATLQTEFVVAGGAKSLMTATSTESPSASPDETTPTPINPGLPDWSVLVRLYLTSPNTPTGALYVGALHSASDKDLQIETSDDLVHWTRASDRSFSSGRSEVLLTAPSPTARFFRLHNPIPLHNPE